ncbi:MAG: DUF167 domain-containing protein [Candidatus Hydrothermarchaeales archaeon]
MADVSKALKKKEGCILLDIIVTTGAERDEILGFDEWRNRLLVRIKERPIRGRANKAIVELFSKLFKVPAKDVIIVKGIKSRQKTLQLQMKFEDAGSLEKKVKELSLLTSGS